MLQGVGKVRQGGTVTRGPALFCGPKICGFTRDQVGRLRINPFFHSHKPLIMSEGCSPSPILPLTKESSRTRTVGSRGFFQDHSSKDFPRLIVEHTRPRIHSMSPSPCCPRCKTGLVLRWSGLTTYLICPNYPNCQGPVDHPKPMQSVHEGVRAA